MKKNEGSKYPVSREELKKILLEGVRALKTYEDARIDHDLNEVKHLLQLDRVEKANELMNQIFVIDKKMLFQILRIFF